MALGGYGVWDNDFVIVCLAETQVTDDDLSVFLNFPVIQTLDLSRTTIRGAGLAYLAGANALEKLVVIDTKLDEEHLASFRREHPGVVVITEPPPKGTINPFTGEPL